MTLFRFNVFSPANERARQARSANEDRADAAMAAIEAHTLRSADHYDRPEDQLGDLLVNLAHLSDRLGVNFLAASQLALDTARSEVTAVDPACAQRLNEWGV